MFKPILSPRLRFIDPVDGANGGGDNAGDNANGEETPTIEDLQAALTAAQADTEKWKGLSRKHEAAAKSAKPAAPAAPDSGEDATAAAIAELRNELAASKREALVARVAAAKGVPASLLSGDDEDSLNDAADALLAFAKGSGKQTPPANDANASGKTGDAVADSKKGQITSRDQLKGLSPADILKLRDEGKLDGLMGK